MKPLAPKIQINIPFSGDGFGKPEFSFNPYGASETQKQEDVGKAITALTQPVIQEIKENICNE